MSCDIRDGVPDGITITGHVGLVWDRRVEKFFERRFEKAAKAFEERIPKSKNADGYAVVCPFDGIMTLSTRSPAIGGFMGYPIPASSRRKPK
jgi:uncharacterized protein YjaG (DUF416 family)